MSDPAPPFELNLHGGDQLELLVADLSVARALHEGVPSARLLARAQLARDMLDLLTWDALVGRLAGGSAQLEKVRRAMARHLRAGIADGPLPASDATVATLVFAVCATDRGDASLAEAFAGESPQRDDGTAFACALHEPRLLQTGAPLRLAMFEAAIRLASAGTAGPWPHVRVVETMTQLAHLAASEAAPQGARWSGGRDLYEGLEAPVGGRKMTYIERAHLDTLVQRDPRELASAIARLERDHPPVQLDRFLADLSDLLKRSGALILAVAPPDPDGATIVEAAPSVPPSDRPSTIPLDWSRADLAAELADAFERSQATFARVRYLVARGGEPALDAIGAEMLRVPLHPQASAAFAEILARSARPRDVVRLVTYFAVAPDPLIAARALSSCASPELPEVLRGWLEAMLPSDGGAVPQGDDPSTSSAARLAACVASLAPYPHLYKAVRPLLVRVTDRPAARL